MAQKNTASLQQPYAALAKLAIRLSSQQYLQYIYILFIKSHIAFNQIVMFHHPVGKFYKFFLFVFLFFTNNQESKHNLFLLLSE